MKVLLGLSFVYLFVVAFLARKKLHELHPKRFFLDTWKELDREAREARAERGDRYDFRPIVSYIALAFVLTMQEYYGTRDMFYRLRDRGITFDWGTPVNGVFPHSIALTRPLSWLQSERWDALYVLAWWALTRGGGYLLVPLILVPLWRERYRDYGLNPKGFLDHAWIYALFFGIVQIAVVTVAQTPEFANYYPFYVHASRSWKDFLLWESIYALQFFALEYFFRGFLLFSSAKSMGSGVIMAMVVPYCMIHYGKPFPETMGAILAGTVLGTLSLKTRSIWSGFLIHVTVAVSMDIAALLQKGGLPGSIRLPSSW